MCAICHPYESCRGSASETVCGWLERASLDSGQPARCAPFIFAVAQASADGVGVTLCSLATSPVWQHGLLSVDQETLPR